MEAVGNYAYTASIIDGKVRVDMWGALKVAEFNLRDVDSILVTNSLSAIVAGKGVFCYGIKPYSKWMIVKLRNNRNKRLSISVRDTEQLASKIEKLAGCGGETASEVP